MTSIKKRTAKIDLKQYGMMMALVAIIVLFAILTGGKLIKPMNISNLIFQNSYVIILAIGMLLCILTGGNIDLACGSVVGLIGACAGSFIIEMDMNVYLAIALCLLIGIAIGMWQGFWIAYVGIPPFIVTLAGMLVFRGVTLLILKGMTLAPFPDAYKNLSTGFIPDFIGEMTLFGQTIKSPLCLLVGILIAVGFCVSQIAGNISKKKKGYETQPVGLMLIKMIAISAVVIWVFYLLSRWLVHHRNGYERIPGHCAVPADRHRHRHVAGLLDRLCGHPAFHCHTGRHAGVPRRYPADPQGYDAGPLPGCL